MATQRPTAEVLDQLRAGIATLTSSDKWAQWLDAQGRFHKYSFGNPLLILLQRSEATRVAGYHTWRKLGRQVRKGEKGIVILAPVASRIRVEDENGDDEHREAERALNAVPLLRLPHAKPFSTNRHEPDMPKQKTKRESQDRKGLRAIK